MLPRFYSWATGGSKCLSALQPQRIIKVSLRSSLNTRISLLAGGGRRVKQVRKFDFAQRSVIKVIKIVLKSGENKKITKNRISVQRSTKTGLIYRKKKIYVTIVDFKSLSQDKEKVNFGGSCERSQDTKARIYYNEESSLEGDWLELNRVFKAWAQCRMQFFGLI